MTLALLALGLAAAGVALVFLCSGLWPRVAAGEPLLGSPRVKYLVVAKTYQQANFHMGDYPRDEWRYLSDSTDLLGYNRGDIEVKLVGEWAQHPIWNDGFAVARLRALGLTAYFEHEQVL